MTNRITELLRGFSDRIGGGRPALAGAGVAAIAVISWLVWPSGAAPVTSTQPTAAVPGHTANGGHRATATTVAASPGHFSFGSGCSPVTPGATLTLDQAAARYIGLAAVCHQTGWPAEAGAALAEAVANGLSPLTAKPARPARENIAACRQVIQPAFSSSGPADVAAKKALRGQISALQAECPSQLAHAGIRRGVQVWLAGTAAGNAPVKSAPTTR